MVTVARNLAIFLWVGLFASNAFSIAEGEAFPKIKIQGLNSDQLSLETLQGKVTILNFWATWCEACKVELVEMQSEFQELLREKDFQFAFVSLDKDPEKATAWVQGHLKDADAFMKHLFKDPSFEAADELGIDSFPMTLVIDTNGKVVKIQRGFKPGEGSTQELAQIARQLLKD